MFHLLVIMAFCAAQVMGEDEWGRAIRKKNFRETLKKFESGSIQQAKPLVQLIKNIRQKWKMTVFCLMTEENVSSN